MANLLRTVDGKMSISWVRRSSVDGEKLHFTLHGVSGGQIGKAPMSAEYIRDYVLLNSIPEAKEARISRLYKELEELLYSAPEESECTSQQEVDMYAEMANLYQAISDYTGS